MKAVILTLGMYAVSTIAHAENLEVTAYFKNDSVNGFQLSDAYETHNMGLRISDGEYYAMLDLGIVSPDMYEYRNRFREANRSFGELVTLEFGQTVSQTNELFFYGRIRASGEFGIDEMQDFAHKVLSLQPVNEVNDLVRMPDNVWYGIGGVYELQSEVYLPLTADVTIEVYLGTDTVYTKIDTSKTDAYNVFDFNYGIGVNLVGYDRVVSADPLNAEVRTINPYAHLGLEFQGSGYKIFVSEVVSMPTIKADNDIYAVLNAGITLEF
jgi:hypothetical protein